MEKGGVVVFPTRGLYGLAADATDPRAVDEVFRIKNRPLDKPLSILVKDMEALERFAGPVGPSARRLMESFWPGHLTVVLPAKPALPPALTGGTGTIGVRLPEHPVALALAKAFGNPLTATSANLSGQPGCSDIRKLAPEILRQCQLVLDSGVLAGGSGTTIVDATGPEVRILREGRISSAQIRQVLEKSN